MFEAAGITTILVTMAPYWAEQHGVPRALAVEFPFAHPIGPIDDVPLQLRVLHEALGVLEGATGPNTVVHSELVWPGDEREWRRAWQPSDAAPLIGKYMAEIRAMRPQQ